VRYASLTAPYDLEFKIQNSKFKTRPVNSMQSAYIIQSLRTPIGKAPRGTLKNIRPDNLATQVIHRILDRTPELTSSQIEDLIIGCAFPEAEQGFNLGRVIAQRVGLPPTVSGMTVNRLCASGLQAIAIAAQSISTGQAEAVLAGGVESMSLIPMGGQHFAPSPDLIANHPEAYTTMGITAENVAQQYHISRQEQDQFALRSHQRALAAIQAGRFNDELVPIHLRETLYTPGIKLKLSTVNAPLSTTALLERELDFTTDEGPRADTNLEALGRLPSVFRRNGSVTAGNASQTSDGAAMSLLVSERLVDQLNLTPLARMVGFAVAGVAPEVMGIGPVEAIPKVLQQTGLDLSQIGLIELNEAFASQAIAVIRTLGLDEEIVNVNGGAIALGHPLGCTGAKLTATLLHEMKRRNVRYGLCSMCIGGGMGAAAVYENLMYRTT
jgi:acetyl-CoA acyltransferase